MEKGHLGRHGPFSVLDGSMTNTFEVELELEL